MNLNVFTEEDAERTVRRVKDPDVPPTRIAKKGKKRPAKAPQVTEDDLYTRLLKYIPAPLIGLYLMAVNAILSGSDGETEKWLLWGAFAVVAIAVAVFLRRRGVKRDSQIAVSVLAFIAWAAASPGPFQIWGDWRQLYGTLALIGMVVVIIALRLKALPDDVINETVTGD